MPVDSKNTKYKIKSELRETQKEFHTFLNSLSEDDLKGKSHNPGWTNGEVLFHMFLGYAVVLMLLPLVKIFGRLPNIFSKVFANILNFLTPIFNAFNAVGARLGIKILGKVALSKNFDEITNRLLKKLDTLKDEEWKKGMYYPNKWDGLFDNYMTIEKLFHYPIKHFKFHLSQIKSLNSNLNIIS